MKDSPLSGVPAYASYWPLAALFAAILALTALLCVPPMVLNRVYSLGLSTYEISTLAQGIAYIAVCSVSLVCLGVSPSASAAGWLRGFPRDLLSALKYFAVYLLGAGLAIGAAMLAVHFWGAGAAATVSRAAPVQPQYAEAAAAAASAPRSVSLAAAMCLIAPLGEELFFRRLLYATLRRRIAMWPALLVSSSVFAATHLTAALTVLPVGLLLGWAYERTGRLQPCVLLHCLVNAFAAWLQVF